MSFSKQIQEKNAGHMSSERCKKKMWDEEEERYEVDELLFMSHDVTGMTESVALICQLIVS